MTQKWLRYWCLNSVITERNKEGKFRALMTGIANMATKNADK